MKDLIRLLAVAVLVFVIVGFSMIYSRDTAFRYGVSTFLSNGWGALGRTVSEIPGLGGNAGEPKLTVTELKLLRPKQRSWVGLTGFPDQMEIRFPVPLAGGFAEGELDLRFDVQLAQSGDGLLSISVNGARRSEIVLNTGHNSYDVRIPLDAGDLLANHVLVQLSTRGTTNSGQICPTDSANSGSAVSVLPESAMILKSMRESNHPETVLMTMSEPLKLQLGTNEEAQALAVWTMQRMRRAGVEAILVDKMQASPSIEVIDRGEVEVSRARNGNVVLAGNDGITRAIAFHRADLRPPDGLTAWPVSVSQLTSETAVRNFRGSKRWTIPYNIADLPLGRMPTNFGLALKASTLAEELEWVVRVSLNGNLVGSSRFPGSIADINMDIALPTQLQGLSNTLVIELIDTSPNQSICRAGPDAQAQLLPESALTADGPQPTDGWGALVRQLAEAAIVSPGNHSLFDVNQATRAAAMVGHFLPTDANTLFAPEAAEMTITLVDKASLIALLEDPGTLAELGQALLITDTGTSALNPLGLHRLGTDGDTALFRRMPPTAIAFLVQRIARP
ncbi:MAG: hypothetical protein Q8O63_07715 [Hoeflea sp.]|nr:hypothetical protein [Hoeflea sp.]